VLYLGFKHPNRRVYHRVVGGIVLATIASFVWNTLPTKIVVLPIVSVLTWAVLRSRPQIDQRVQRICGK
jgi:chromate transport protein ChrA